MNVQVLIPAAGFGLRLGEASPKALVPLDGKPLLIRTLERFAIAGLCQNAIITAPQEYINDFEQALGSLISQFNIVIIPGGKERQQSVLNGLNALSPDTGIVVIHDAARPFISVQAINASIEAAAQFGAATVAIPAIDTILQADEKDMLVNTPDRRFLWACQTPQTFRVAVIREAHAWALANNFLGTDDATLVRAMGKPVKLVQGSPLNYKITTPEDRLIAELLIEKNAV